MVHWETLVQTTISNFSHEQVKFNLYVAMANTSCICPYAGRMRGDDTVEMLSISPTASSSSKLEDISNMVSAPS